MNTKLTLPAVAVVAAMLLVGGGVYYYWYYHRSAPATLASPAPPKAIEKPKDVHPPEVCFVDITEPAGIDFVHTNGSTGDKLLPETMGSGAAFLDYDNDGDPDLLLVNFAPWLDRAADDKPATQAFYRNDGQGQFTQVTAEVGLDVTLYGMGAAAGDFDNDGFTDLVITGLSGNRLYHNRQGKRFEEVTGSGMEANHGWSTGAAFLDANRDGKLDLFICNYVRWTPEIDRKQGFTLTGIGRAFGPPKNFEGAHCQLFFGHGDGTFDDVTESAGLRKFDLEQTPKGKALGVIACDLDRDGWTDLIVANDTVQNFLWHNLGNGHFEEVGESSGIAYGPAGETRGAMGIDAADYRGDGSTAVAIGNFADEPTALYVAQGKSGLAFSDEAVGAGVAQPSRLLLKFGVQFFDYDLDSRLDLLTSNGHLEEEISRVNASQTYAQPAQLFWNSGTALRRDFVAVTAEHAGPDLFRPIVGRGLATADIDGDGDLDMLLTSNGGRPLLLRNDGGSRNHWLRVALEGDGTHVNRSGYGTRVEISAAGVTQRQELAGGRSYLSQSELVLTFGLGRAAKIDQVAVTWLDGTHQVLKDVKPDQLIRVAYSSAIAKPREKRASPSTAP
jgi:hypothetical protein